MLNDEIEKAQRLVRTDAYQMSIGEIVSMYDTREMVIDPEFQRLFRWDNGQQSKLIESILLGIPLPSIFVLGFIYLTPTAYYGAALGFSASVSRISSPNRD
jgi:Protein of unknown function DUF262